MLHLEDLPPHDSTVTAPPMMHQDYLVRQFQQVSQALGRVLFKKQQQQYDEALEEIRNAGELFLGLDLGNVRAVTYADVVQRLEEHERAGADYLSFSAELFRHQGDILAHQHRLDDATLRRLDGLRLHLDLFFDHDGFRSPDHVARTDEILDALALSELPPDLLPRLFRYLDATGRYARAEDLLFLRLDHPDEDLYDEGVAFFRRLLQYPADRLQAGHLPRHEVAEGLKAFKKRCQRE